MKVIVYESNTGTSKKYAEALSEKRGIPCYHISDCLDIAPESEVIFIGWIMGNEIQGLKKAREFFPNISTILAVGMMKNDKHNDAIAEKNSIGDDVVFRTLPGAFDMNKLKGMYKMMMGMMMKMIKSKLKESADKENSEKILRAFEEGIDMYDESALEGIAE